MSIDKSSLSCSHGKGVNCKTCWPDIKRHRVYGREFAVIAEFPDSVEGVNQANDFMLKHQSAGVLANEDGRIILASVDDAGIVVETAYDAAVNQSLHWKQPCFDYGHWYQREGDGILFIVPDDRHGTAETTGPDDMTLKDLEAAYRSVDQIEPTWFDKINRVAIAEELGLVVVQEWQQRFDSELGYYVV